MHAHNTSFSISQSLIIFVKIQFKNEPMHMQSCYEEESKEHVNANLSGLALTDLLAVMDQLTYWMTDWLTDPPANWLTSQHAVAVIKGKIDKELDCDIRIYVQLGATMSSAKFTEGRTYLCSPCHSDAK